MQAHPKSIGSLFNSAIHLFAPVFQRAYVWERERNWEPLWDDIQNIADQRLDGVTDIQPHFLGAVVVEQVQSPTGLQCRKLIDGQQRLTTLQILFAVLRDYSARLTREDPSLSLPPFENLILNKDLYDIKDEAYSFKVWTTRQNQEEYRQVMEARDLESLRKTFKINTRHTSSKQHLLARAYVFFHDQLESWLEEVDDVGLAFKYLWETIQKHIQVVSIDLDERDNPQIIFETLNARGTPLLQSDLIKNYLFYQAKDSLGDTSQIYDKYWIATFEREDAEFWKQPPPGSRHNLPHLEIFLRQYLAMKEGKDIVASSLFESYKRYFEPAQEQIEQEFQDLRDYATIYRDLHEFEARIDDADDRFLHLMKLLRALDSTVFNPFIMRLVYAFNSDYANKEMGSICSDLESYVMRRALCKMSNKQYNKLASEWAHLIHERTTVDRDLIRTACFLKSDASTAKWPTDEELEKAWIYSPTYKRLPQKTIRTALLSIETYRVNKLNEAVVTPTAQLTIEHIMPQEWTLNWSSSEDETKDIDFIERRTKFIHSMGNLTLLTQPLNSSVSNGPWSEKRKMLQKHTALGLNREIVHNEQWEETWDEDTIEQRGRSLFHTALEIWPRPLIKAV